VAFRHRYPAQDFGKEDALKIAKYLRDMPEEDQCIIPLPGEEEEAFRANMSMKEFLKWEQVTAINQRRYGG
jgi:hypothetical protein